jgi:peptidoglycan hydrolase-like protein with peptidoglycan-binding domain
MTTHAEARVIIKDAFKHVFGREPTPLEAIFAQAVALHETGYGQAWKGDGAGSNNWGAVQGTGNAGFFVHGDTHADGSKYTTKFKKYLSAQDGADDLIVQVYGKGRPGVLDAATRGAFSDAVTAMRKGGYFEASLTSYTNAINTALKAIAEKLGDKLPPLAGPAPIGSPSSGPPSPSIPSSVLRYGSVGPVVERWQRIVHVTPDGDFGPITERATLVWQRAHNLVADGIVGPKTWAMALQDG